jgi:hypothetical protein
MFYTIHGFQYHRNRLIRPCGETKQIADVPANPIHSR